MKRFPLILTLVLCVIFASAMTIQMTAPDDGANASPQEGAAPGGQPSEASERIANLKQRNEERRNKSSLEKYRDQQAKLRLQQDTIPDSLLNPRWKIQRTTPITYDDLKQGTTDLKRPDNIKQEVVYNDTIDRYVIGTRMGKTWMAAPIMMDLTEYQKWSEKKLMTDFFHSKNSEIFEKKGKEKFDFTDMHFDLGPAEKIFGPGGIRVKTQGSAELKLGATLKSIDNPSLPIRNRNTTTIDFDEKINVNVTGKIGDKMNMNLNYNTDATFDYDAQNMKLKYEGKEDEIIKLVEAGNVSFPSNSSLVQGASSLFGIRTDLQFGKLKLQTVFSQKKSSSSSVSTKGGTQFTPFDLNVANYEENRHFFLGMFFYSNYDSWMAKLPTPLTGVTINRVEVWVTNKSGQSSNTRNIVAIPQLGEGSSANTNPYNRANGMYDALVALDGVRNIDLVNETLEGKTIGSVTNMTGGKDYEKIEKARLLSSSEYSVNSAMGYISLKTALQSDQVVAIAYEYTYNGVSYQVGEFSSDITDINSTLIVKSLKNTTCTPSQPNWKLMMRNVYYLASSVQKEKFKLDVKYQSDSTGVYVSYIPETVVKSLPIIKLIGADRLDNNNKAHSNGQFDFVEGYTVSNGRVFFPSAEPFGNGLIKALKSHNVSESVAQRYAFTDLYEQTKTAAKQNTEKNRFQMIGQFKGSSANVISLGAYNVPQGSVKVTAGGVELTEGTDYSVDYSAGEVTILNQSIIDAGTNVNVSLESDADYGMQRKTMLGLNWEYDFSKDFQLSGTLQHLSEQSLTSKVSMGAEPVKNTLVGLNLNWKKESQWLTNILNKIPLLHVSQPSTIQFNAEFAKLFSSTAGGTQDNASYVDDFENTTTHIDVSTPTSWIISSVPSVMEPAMTKDNLESGYHRARLAWYYIDPLFTRRSSTLTPSYIKGNDEMLSQHSVREVYVNELYPNRDQSTYNGATSTLSILNLAYYPQERGPYNFNPNIDSQGRLPSPTKNWGGMMRKLDTNNFEEANIEYIEFWMMDPGKTNNKSVSGRMHINLGEVSEDVLYDGKKFYESGMPVTDNESTVATQWGLVPDQNTVTYAFATSSGSREKQDVGFNGLTDEQEFNWDEYAPFREAVLTNVTNDSLRQAMLGDLANDNYRYFRGSLWDDRRASILDRYKYINNPQGNSPDSESRTESYDTSYKSGPDVEDINQDFTLNEYENYYDYILDVSTDSLVMGSHDNYCVDRRVANVTLRNGQTSQVTWYQFRIPLAAGIKRGSISDFSSIRFMRIYLEGFSDETILRFGSLDLVRGDWRVYESNTLKGASENPYKNFTASSISIEENSEKLPVNYVLPPGISRVVDPSQPQLVENNEQAMRFDVKNMAHKAAVAVYKNTNYDMRYYKRLQMFAHANALEINSTNLQSGQLALFIRLGADYNNNFYEYEIPLKLTPAGRYSLYSESERAVVWPNENMLNIELSKFTDLKKVRNIKKSNNELTLNDLYSEYDPDNQSNKISIVGNPSLGEVKAMMIGVRNLASDIKDGEIWVNELRLLEPESEGGWAAAANLNVQLSDLGSVQATGRYISDGYGGLEQKVTQRSTEKYATYSVTTSLELGKFFPDKAKVTAPLYYSITRERVSPKYNPLDTDMLLDDALESSTKKERDSIESIAITKTVNKNFSLSGVRFGISTKRHPMPYDPANFTFSYSHSSRHTEGESKVYENEDNWKGGITYSWTPVYKAYLPFQKIKSKSKYYDILKAFTLNWLPQNISANTEMTRYYYELQERDLDDLGSGLALPPTFSSQFLWNRSFSMRWDLTKNLHLNFSSATRAEIEEPYTVVNKDLYPDRYQAWKDSVWMSIKKMGTPLDYNQNFNASYQLPLNQIPVLNWLQADGSYSSTYQWARGAEEDGVVKYGNTISNNRTININSTLTMEKLYNQIPFLKKVNERFAKPMSKTQLKKKADARKAAKAKAKEEAAKAKEEAEKNGENADAQKKKAEQQTAKNSSKLKNAFSRDITINADTSMVITHGKKSRRLVVSAKDSEGHHVKVKYKKVDDNKIEVFNNTDSAMNIKLSVVALEPLDNMKWYKVAQSAARLLMMVRSIGVTYRNQYSMALPGFMPTVGNIFGQRTGGAMSPGLDFAFGFIGDSYIDKARSNGWLLHNESLSTPATTNKTQDVQVRVTLEPIRNLKIDLNAAHTQTKSKSIQYQFGNRTTQSGTFSMTTISIKSAFEGMGNANNGFYSATFEKFCNILSDYHTRVQNQYIGTTYPKGSGEMAGHYFDPANGEMDKYSADVMVPAFLKAYTGYNGLKIFPTLAKMLPNWTLKYSGLTQLTWFSERFKSFNINHGYKSIYAVGSYNSYSTYLEFMGDQIGFISDSQTGSIKPNSMFNVSTVSINEAFSPLLGIDFTLPNDLTFKAEYRTTRVLSLSMTSVQINEAISKDWVFGLAYKIKDFRLFNSRARLAARNKNKAKGNGDAETNKTTTAKTSTTTKGTGFAHDLNIRLDFSYRQQAAITRDIATVTSTATSGNNAFKLAFAADYSLSKLLTMSIYYDRQSNSPLLSSSSYPTVTQDFGVSLKFSLTR